MKNELQKLRMSEHNPMKNNSVKEKVKEKISKKIVLGNVVYSSAKDLAKTYGVYDTAIQYWLKRGYGRNLQPCYYLEDGPKQYIIKNHETSNKPVIIDGKVFKNVKTGAEYIGVWSETLIRAIKNNKLCKGHTCEYVNQQPSTNLNG